MVTITNIIGLEILDTQPCDWQNGQRHTSEQQRGRPPQRPGAVQTAAAAAGAVRLAPACGCLRRQTAAGGKAPMEAPQALQREALRQQQDAATAGHLQSEVR